MYIHNIVHYIKNCIIPVQNHRIIMNPWNLLLRQKSDLSDLYALCARGKKPKTLSIIPAHANFTFTQARNNRQWDFHRDNV